MNPFFARWWGRAEIVVFVTAVACFINVLPNDFCFDDDLIVRSNPKVNAPGQWVAVWTSDHWSETQDATPNRDLLYRPISLSSYRLVRIICGVRPFAQHLVNVLLHALVCVLIVRLCRHAGGGEPAALVGGLLFAVLPIHTEVIASVVGRADLLATLGVLAALLAHRRSCLVATASATVAWRSAAALAALFAMGSKESGISAVPLAILMDAYWQGCSRGQDNNAGWWSWRTVVRLAYLLVPLAAYLALRYHTLGGHIYQHTPATKTVNILVDAPTWQHVLGVAQLWGMYWAKTLWPGVLSIKYSINSIRLATSPMDPHVILGVATAAGLVAASLAARRRGVRSVAFLSAALVVSYLPIGNALVLIQVFFAERVWYLPSVWIAVLAGVALALYDRAGLREALGVDTPRGLKPAAQDGDTPRGLEDAAKTPGRIGHGRMVMRRPVLGMAFGVLVLGMMARCWLRNAEWRDNGTLYAAAYHDQPDAVGPLQLYGQWLVNHDRFDDGIRLLSRAVEIDLGFTDAHRNLGEAYLRSGDLRAALHHLQTADMQVPGHPPTERELARVSRELAERDDELMGLRRRANENPDDVDAEITLVRRLRELALVHEAELRLRELESRFSRNASWQAEYAVTLVYAGRRDQAIERYRKCLELAPDDPQLGVELAMLLLERREGGDLDEAWRRATRAAESAPTAPAVLSCRAELLAVRGDLAAAVQLYDQAIRALPPASEQRRVFEERARALGRRP